MERYEVTEDWANKRLDQYLAAVSVHSRNAIQQLIKEKRVLVNGEAHKANYKVKVGDICTLEEFVVKEIDITPQNIPLDIVYEDEDIVVVNKADNMVVHPGAGNWDNTLVNALLYHVPNLKAIKGEVRPGIVHRIDKQTSGLLVVAKNAKALENLAKQLVDKTMSREYLALVEGVIPHNKGKIDAPIGRDLKHRQKMAVVKGGKNAITYFTVLKRFDDKTLIKCKLETGRTHQIRVHLKYIGYPIYGDPVYGRKKTDTTHGQYLHAFRLKLIHPITKKEMIFTANPPVYFNQFVAIGDVDA